MLIVACDAAGARRAIGTVQTLACQARSRQGPAGRVEPVLARSCKTMAGEIRLDPWAPSSGHEPVMIAIPAGHGSRARLMRLSSVCLTLPVDAVRPRGLIHVRPTPAPRAPSLILSDWLHMGAHGTRRATCRVPAPTKEVQCGPSQ